MRRGIFLILIFWTSALGADSIAALTSRAAKHNPDLCAHWLKIFKSPAHFLDQGSSVSFDYFGDDFTLSGTWQQGEGETEDSLFINDAVIKDWEWGQKNLSVASGMKNILIGMQTVIQRIYRQRKFSRLLITVVDIRHQGLPLILKQIGFREVTDLNGRRRLQMDCPIELASLPANPKQRAPRRSD